MAVEAYSCARAAPGSSPTSTSTWNRVSITIDQLCEAANIQDSPPIALVDTAPVASPHERNRLTLAFHIPQKFWTSLCEDSSGFFSAYEHHSLHTQERSHRQAFRFLIKQRVTPNAPLVPTQLAYRWDRLGFVTCWQPHGNLAVLCFDTPAALKQDLRDRLAGSEPLTQGHGAFALHPMLLMSVVRSFDTAVWSWRDVVRKIEETRDARKAVSMHSFADMHETACHVIHCSDMLTTAQSVMESISDDIRDYATRGLGSPDPEAILREVDFSRSLLTSLLHRSHALEKRLQNEINLAFHLYAQHNGQVTARIAGLAQRDGEVMKGVSVLGMVFLPGTFVSAVFSMSFFDFAGPGPAVSGHFWLYWAIAVPLTVLTLVSWHLWQRGHSHI
ncbi:hypothetical protein LTR53_005017 [Teratosphaeriaceae sp. CCFEE 6253]|nr:hypothetical protein LTR53_005017 [Teratosphaeriaceae sp. CCFEE 6253]